MRFLFFLFFFSWFSVQAQKHAWPQPPPDNAWSRKWAMQAELLPWLPYQGAEVQQLDAALYKYQQPLNLNEATLADFLALGLPKLQAEAILEYRATYREFFTAYELMTVPGLDSAWAHDLLPLVAAYSVVKMPLLNSAPLAAMAQMRFQSGSAAWSDPVLAAQPTNLLLRARATAENGWKANLTVQQDAGERFLWTPKQAGFDFLSGSLAGQWHRPGLSALLLGDYTITSGHGLVQGHGRQLSRGANTATSLMGFRAGATPYYGMAEFGFLRGAAATFLLGQQAKDAWQLTPYVSYKLLDARLTISDDESWFTQSLPSSGYHRTYTEYAGRASLPEFITGMRIIKPWLNDLGVEAGQWGATVQRSQYGASIPVPGSDSSYSSGTQQLSTWAQTQWQGWYLSAEAALSHNGTSTQPLGYALSTEAMKVVGVRAGRPHTLTIRYRHYSALYTAPYPAAFGRASLPNGEQGLYLGIQRSATRGWTYSIWADSWLWSIPRYRIAQPGVPGIEYQAHLSHKAAEHVFTLTARGRHHARNVTGATGLGPVPMATFSVWQQDLRYRYLWPVAVQSEHLVGYTVFSEGREGSAADGGLRYRKTVPGAFTQHSAAVQIRKNMRATLWLLAHWNTEGDGSAFLTEPEPLWVQALVVGRGTGIRIGALYGHKLALGSGSLLMEAKAVHHLTDGATSTSLLGQLTWQWKKPESRIVLW